MNLEESLAAAKLAMALAEKYGDAIARISEALSDPARGDRARVLRARTIIAGLDREADHG